MQAVPAALAMTTDTYGFADAVAGMLQLLHGNGLQHSHVQLGAGERWGGTGKYQRPRRTLQGPFRAQKLAGEQVAGEEGFEPSIP